MKFFITSEATQTDRNVVCNKLFQFNSEHFPHHLRGRYKEVNLYVKNAAGQIYGGIICYICWNWMEVHYFFVDEQIRNLGYGKKLLNQAEKIAKENGCDFVKLDTLSFQAINFYKKQGYTVFGEIENAGGHTHYYLMKNI